MKQIKCIKGSRNRIIHDKATNPDMSDMDDETGNGHGHGNYDDFMVSEDESLQMEFESEEDEQVQLEDNDIEMNQGKEWKVDVESKGGHDMQAKMNQLIISAEELMDNGKWDAARCQYSSILQMCNRTSMQYLNIDMLPLWMNVMNCWSRNLYYNTNEIDTQSLFDDCHQFGELVYMRLQQGELSADEMNQLPLLVNDILPVLTRQYMFDMNGLDLLILQKKVRLQLSLCERLEPLTRVNDQMNELLCFKRNVGRQWERVIALCDSREGQTVATLVDLMFFDDLIGSLLKGFESGTIETKSFNQDLMIRELKILFQMYVLGYSRDPTSSILAGYNRVMRLLLDQFEQSCGVLLILSQDSSLMLLFHFSYAIALMISHDEIDHVGVLRGHFLCALQQVERLGVVVSIDDDDDDDAGVNEYHQFIFVGFILTSIFLHLDQYDDTMEHSTVLNPFEYEQIKLIGKSGGYRETISLLQNVFHELTQLNITKAHGDLQRMFTILESDAGFPLSQFDLMKREILHMGIKLRLVYRLVPVYERLSIVDLQRMLSFDEAMLLTRDEVVSLLMEMMACGSRCNNKTRSASFKIDFVEDHVLLFENVANGAMSSNCGNGNTDKTTNGRPRASTSEFFMRIPGVNDDPETEVIGDIQYNNASGGVDTVDDNPTFPSTMQLPQLQLQAAELVSQTLSANATSNCNSNANATANANTSTH